MNLHVCVMYLYSHHCAGKPDCNPGSRCCTFAREVLSFGWEGPGYEAREVL